MSSSGSEGHWGSLRTEHDTRTQFQCGSAAGRQLAAWTWACTGTAGSCTNRSVRWRGRRGDHDGEGMKNFVTREKESTRNTVGSLRGRSGNTYALRTYN